MNVLKPTKQKLFSGKVFGFDIETANSNKEFVLASIYGENYEQFFYSPEEITKELKTNNIFRNSYIFATNLSFDFFGTFFDGDDKYFYTLFRGSDLLFAETHFDEKGNFIDKSYRKDTKNEYAYLRFLDTLNYAKLSVEKMGKILKIPKLEKPDFLGQRPKDKEETEILKAYNLRDSEISYKFMKFVIDAFEHLGASFKMTLASTSMSLFRNKYLKDKYFHPEEPILLEQFESYYGGRTEAFKRGTFYNYNYYDFNSLYPSVMALNPFPNPNSLRVHNSPDESYIKDYEGVSNVIIECPLSLKYPLLPKRLKNGRVVFATGILSGWYCHTELREALRLGYKIHKIIKSQYFTKVCYPFKDFVTDLYELRKKFKEKANPMQMVTKLLMNSLYGKFGQRFTDKDNWIHEKNLSEEDLLKYDNPERIGNYFRIVESKVKPAVFCIPIWASYVASYGRLKLHKAIMQTNPIYCDTDSVITDKVLNDSLELGELKLESKIKVGIVVRPKFYAFVDNNKKEEVKIKGLGKRLNILEFAGLLAMDDHTIHYTKFAKFKEAIRRGLVPNEIIKVHKEFSLEDEKRIWPKEFNEKELQDSDPLILKTEE